MTYSLVPFTQQYLNSAVELFLKGYSQEQSYNPYLPSRAMEDPNWIRTILQSKLANPGVAIVEGNHLLAYMVTGEYFTSRGQRSVIVPEYGHSTVDEKKQYLYQIIYRAIAQEWVNQHCHLHIIGHFAHDTILQGTLYQLGFGSVVAERLRDCSFLTGYQEIPINEVQDIRELIDLQMEHVRYYSESPIFLSRSTDRSSALDDLSTHAKNGDVFFAYYDQSKPCAYMIVGESPNRGEGFLLQKTKTAQIKSAYARMEFRGKGIGEALLQHAIQWAQQQGFDRIFVEHETANIAGGNFWGKFFSPYLNFSMRYIDNSF